METKAYTGHNFYDSYLEYVEDNPLYQVEYRVFRMEKRLNYHVEWGPFK